MTLNLSYFVVILNAMYTHATYQFDYTNGNYLNGNVVQYEYNNVKKTGLMRMHIAKRPGAMVLF